MLCDKFCIPVKVQSSLWIFNNTLSAANLCDKGDMRLFSRYMVNIAIDKH